MPPISSFVGRFSFQNFKCFDYGTELRDAAHRFVSNDPTVVGVYCPIVANWCVDRVTTFDNVFNSLNFNEPLTNWNTSSATSMYAMFAYAKTFNQPIEQFQVSRVVNFNCMFFEAEAFDQSLLTWGTSSAISMRAMFEYSSFSHPVNHFVVDNMQDFLLMFYGSRFNQPIPSWSTLSARMMISMFCLSPFNQNISHFAVDKVTRLDGMFTYGAFNHDISNWNISSASTTYRMFYYASSFNQNLGSWGPALANGLQVNGMFDGTSCPYPYDPDLTAVPRGPLCHYCGDTSNPIPAPSSSPSSVTKVGFERAALHGLKEIRKPNLRFVS